MPTHSGILAWRVPEERSLAGYSPRGSYELDMTEQLNMRYTHTHTRVLRLRRPWPKAHRLAAHVLQHPGDPSLPWS